ncbi:hypothetical protein NDU88_009990 [Pleurodeles waltl]|uniref:Uncharacterized protein n=1 Tax=Pleurodeles waltl TaxID=8319 RepID=A0AAV7PUG1_PLEWA|nr:hypothetical protein NDU88_009990 [Pleurodeles waltl]
METRRGRTPSTEPNGPAIAAAVPCTQLGPVAEHAHGDAARLRPSHDRGWNCGTEQMKTGLLGNCYSITPNAGMVKRDSEIVRCADLAFVILKRLIATQWKSPSAPDSRHWIADVQHWVNAEIQVLHTLRDIGVVVKRTDIWDSFADQLQEKDDTRPP